MKHLILCLLLWIPALVISANADDRTVINLNGAWQFDQTTTAFPPAKFTRTIPVPGLVHLAIPKIDDYDKLFKRADRVKLESFLRTDIPVSMILPAETGGYVLVDEFTPENGRPAISRRYLKVGQAEEYSYFNLNPMNK